MEFRAILTALAAAEVDFVVVGGVAAVLQGVPTNTFDLDLVHARDPVNRERLARVLKGLTDAGPLDLLGTIVGGRDYEQLVEAAIGLDVEGREVRVVDLPTLIRIKEELGREKDLIQLQLLRHTLEERRRGE